MSPLQVSLLAVWLLALALGAPGHLSYDSVVQLAEARSAVYAGGHPPLMSALLGLFDRVVPGTALYLLFASALFYLPLIALVATPRTRRRAHWIAAALLLATLASPLILVTQGVIWKDVLFANLAVAGFTGLVLAERSEGYRRIAWLAVGALCAALAAATRQNGFVVPLFAAIAVAVATWLHRRRTIPAIGHGLAWLLLSIALYAAAQGAVQATAARHGGSGVAWGIGVLQRFDIAGMIAHGAPMPMLPATEPVEAERLRAAIAHAYHPSRVEVLNSDPDARSVLRGTWAARIEQIWWDMLRSSPIAWIQHRASVARWMLAPPDVRRCLPIWVGVEGPPELLATLGLAPGARPQDQSLYRYASAWFDTPLFLNISWAVLALALLACLLRRRCRAPGDAAILALLCAALVFAGSFVLIGIACDVRYLFLLPCACCLALAHLARPAFHA